MLNSSLPVKNARLKSLVREASHQPSLGPGPWAGWGGEHRAWDVQVHGLACCAGEGTRCDYVEAAGAALCSQEDGLLSFSLKVNTWFLSCSSSRRLCLTFWRWDFIHALPFPHSPPSPSLFPLPMDFVPTPCTAAIVHHLEEVSSSVSRMPVASAGCL